MVIWRRQIGSKRKKDWMIKSIRMHCTNLQRKWIINTRQCSSDQSKTIFVWQKKKQAFSCLQFHYLAHEKKDRRRKEQNETELKNRTRIYCVVWEKLVATTGCFTEMKLVHMKSTFSSRRFFFFFRCFFSISALLLSLNPFFCSSKKNK